MKLLNRDEFDALPANEQRVAIAKDVILRLEADMMYPSCGNLVNVPTDENEWTIEDLQGRINQPNIECTACAKGALILSWIGNFNHYSHEALGTFQADFSENNVNKKYPKELMDIFGRKMLDLMEIEFERFVYGWSHPDFQMVIDSYGSLVEDEYLPTGKYCGDLRSIMENIVENNGEFIP